MSRVVPVRLKTAGPAAQQCAGCGSIYAFVSGMFRRDASAPAGFSAFCDPCRMERVRATRSNPVAAAALARRQQRQAWHDARTSQVDAYLSGTTTFEEFIDSVG